MAKKFDVVIGNPPYQDDLIGDNESKAPPIYHQFMDAAFEVATIAVLITPARFLSNAGQTPKWWNHCFQSNHVLSSALACRRVSFNSSSGDPILPMLSAHEALATGTISSENRRCEVHSGQSPSPNRTEMSMSGVRGGSPW